MHSTGASRSSPAPRDWRNQALPCPPRSTQRSCRRMQRVAAAGNAFFSLIGADESRRGSFHARSGRLCQTIASAHPQAYRPTIWNTCPAGVPTRHVPQWARASSRRFSGDPSHASALLQDPGRADKTSPLTVLPTPPPANPDRRPQRAHSSPYSRWSTKESLPWSIDSFVSQRE
jgi:hypothetical protein